LKAGGQEVPEVNDVAEYDRGADGDIAESSGSDSDPELDSDGTNDELEVDPRNPPALANTQDALDALVHLLKSKIFHENPFIQERLQAVASVLHLYLNPSSIAYQKWIEASIQVAITQGRGQTSWSRCVCAWAQKYIRVRSIPTNPYGR
jgi:hypothetical protein